MKKSLAFLLAALLLSSAFASCSGTTDDVRETDPANADTAAEETITEETEPETEADLRLWEGKSFDGYTVNIFGRQDTNYSFDFWADEITGQAVNDAVYNRNEQVETDLNIDLQYIPTTLDDIAFNQNVVNSVRSADGAYDIVAANAYYGVSMVLENALYDLHKMPNITLDNSWYNQSFVSEMTIYDQLYFVVGDLTMTATDRMKLTFINKDLIGTYLDIVDLYQVVYDGKWTIDYFQQLIAETWHDVNGNGARDGYSDIFGFAVYNEGSIPADGLIASLGIKVASKNSEGNPEISMYNEHSVTVYEKLRKLYHDTSGTNPAMDGWTFLENKVMTVMGCANFAVHLRDFEPEYGVLPLPKFDEAQEKYITTSQDAYNIVCVPSTCSNTEAVGAAIDYLSCLSREEVYPKYYESTFQRQYMRTEQDAEMFDLIRDGLEFNVGVVYSNCIGNPVWIFRDTLIQNGEFASAYQSKAKVSERILEKFLEQIKPEENVQE